MTDEDRTHGQTYGEAVDEVLKDTAEAVASAEVKAASLRSEGGIRNRLLAKYLEIRAKDLEESGESLYEKRRKMPFGLDSAQGFGEVMENPAITLAEETQRDANDEDER